MKLDILAIGAHPDDVELSAAGTIIGHVQKKYKCGILDLTRGELGTRGTAETRKKEAKAAASIMGIHVRESLKMDDGFFEIEKENLLQVVSVIRKYRPDIILSNAVSDRHPDHAKAAQLVNRAVFLAGLKKVKTNEKLDAWKAGVQYHYIQDRFIKPDFIVDISSHWEKKMEAIMAYKTQFYDPSSKEPVTPISTKDFLSFLEARAIEFGRTIGVKYGEGFTVERTPGVSEFGKLI